MAASNYYETVQKIYIAYYGRAADPGGLEYWADRLDQVSGNLSEIIEAFANSAESAALYASSSDEDKVTAIYQQLFNRDPDPGGLAFYTGKLATGEMTQATIMLNVLDGARNEDLLIIENKLSASTSFTDTLVQEEAGGYAGNLAASQVRNWLSSVDDSNDSLTTATGQLTQLVHQLGIETQITVTDLSVSESSSSAEITLARSGYLYQDSTLDYSTADGSANAGADYTDTSGNITFASGESSKTIEIPLLNDSQSEGSESFSLNFSNLTNSTVSQDSIQITVLDDDSSAFSRVETGIDSSSQLSLGDTPIISLESDEYWTETSLTYGFNQSIPDEYNDADLELDLSGWGPLSEAAQQATRDVVAELQKITQLTLTEDNSGNADIRFNALSMTDSAGFAYYAGEGIGGDVFLDVSTLSSENYQTGTFTYHTLVHELSHALGLKHPFEEPNKIATELDNNDYTAMSYTEAHNLRVYFSYSAEDFSIGASYDWSAMPPSYSLLDLAALQAIYGANTETATEDNTYSLSFDDYTYLTIWDGGGEDTINVSTTSGNSTIDMRAGQYSSVDVHTLEDQIAATLSDLSDQGAPDFTTFVTSAHQDEAANLYTGENNLAIAYGVWIENVFTGSGDDTVRDNAVNNTIQTGAGNDTIQLFGGGLDNVDGGAGTDTVQVNETSDQVNVQDLGNNSYLLTGQNFSAQIVGIETLTFTDSSMQLG